MGGGRVSRASVEHTMQWSGVFPLGAILKVPFKLYIVKCVLFSGI